MGITQSDPWQNPDQLTLPTQDDNHPNPDANPDHYYDANQGCFIDAVSKGKSYWNKGYGKDKGAKGNDKGKGKGTGNPYPFDCPICHQPGGVAGKSHSAQRCPSNYYNNYNKGSLPYSNNYGNYNKGTSPNQWSKGP